MRANFRGSPLHAVLFLAWLLLAIAAHAQEATPRTPVRLHDAPVFTLIRGDGTRTVEERARAASRSLAEAAATPHPEAVHVAKRGSIAVVMVGTTPIVELAPEDAQLSGDSSLDVLSGRVASSVREALRKEQRRTQTAETVFSISLVVFFGLVTLYLVRRLHDIVTSARSFVQEHPESVPSLRVSSLEVLGSAALRGLIVVLLGVGRWLGVLGLFYAWLVVSLSLFEQTRPYTERLTGMLFSPLSAFVGRLAGALPVLVIALFAGAAVLVLLRVITLFFASIERREIHVSWLAPELAPAAGTLLRVALVVGTLVFAAPLVTGNADGALSRIGLLAVLALALGSAPLLASSAVGLSVIFSRGLSVGDRAEYGGERGIVRAIGITVLTLEGEDGSSVKVPHLRALWHPTRLFPRPKKS